MGSCQSHLAARILAVGAAAAAAFPAAEQRLLVLWVGRQISMLLVSSDSKRAEWQQRQREGGSTRGRQGAAVTTRGQINKASEEKTQVPTRGQSQASHNSEQINRGRNGGSDNERADRHEVVDNRERIYKMMEWQPRRQQGVRVRQPQLSPSTGQRCVRGAVGA